MYLVIIVSCWCCGGFGSESWTVSSACIQYAGLLVIILGTVLVHGTSITDTLVVDVDVHLHSPDIYSILILLVY